MEKEEPATMNFNLFAKTVLVFIGIVAFAGTTIYFVAGEEQSDAVQQESKTNVGTVGSLIGGLQARLDENPDDAKGWLLLARSHDHLGDDAAAWTAYARAKELGLTDAGFEQKLLTGLGTLAAQ